MQGSESGSDASSRASAVLRSASGLPFVPGPPYLSSFFFVPSLGHPFFLPPSPCPSRFPFIQPPLRPFVHHLFVRSSLYARPPSLPPLRPSVPPSLPFLPLQSFSPSPQTRPCLVLVKSQRARGFSWGLTAILRLAVFPEIGSSHCSARTTATAITRPALHCVPHLTHSFAAFTGFMTNFMRLRAITQHIIHCHPLYHTDRFKQGLPCPFHTAFATTMPCVLFLFRYVLCVLRHTCFALP